jgi:hypothetical protein
MPERAALPTGPIGPAYRITSEPENQSNLNKNALWKHWLFSVDFRARGHSFSNSQPASEAASTRTPGPMVEDSAAFST